MTNELSAQPLDLPEDARLALTKRLRRIEGQVRGLQKMVDEQRAVADVLVQITSVQEALRGVGKVLLQHHLAVSVSDAIRVGDAEQSDRMVAELVALWGK